MKTKLLLLAALISLSSCTRNEQESKMMTDSSMANPETIGTLPDGRVVKTFTRTIANSSYPHHIYFIENGDGGKTVSNNYLKPVGKTQVNETIVLIDGVKYVPLEKHEN